MGRFQAPSRFVTASPSTLLDLIVPVLAVAANKLLLNFGSSFSSGGILFTGELGLETNLSLVRDTSFANHFHLKN